MAGEPRVVVVSVGESPTTLVKELGQRGLQVSECGFADAEEEIDNTRAHLVVLYGSRGAMELATLLDDPERSVRPRLAIVAGGRELSKLWGLNREIVVSLLAAEMSSRVISDRLVALAKQWGRPQKEGDAALSKTSPGAGEPRDLAKLLSLSPHFDPPPSSATDQEVSPPSSHGSRPSPLPKTNIVPVGLKSGAMPPLHPISMKERSLPPVAPDDAVTIRPEAVEDDDRETLAPGALPDAPTQDEHDAITVLPDAPAPTASSAAGPGALPQPARAPTTEPKRSIAAPITDKLSRPAPITAPSPFSSHKQTLAGTGPGIGEQTAPSGPTAPIPADAASTETPASKQESQTPKPSETRLPKSKPSELQPSESSELQPSESSELQPLKPSELQPSETQPSELQPSETQPSETQPAETTQSKPKPAEERATSVLARPAQAKWAEAERSTDDVLGALEIEDALEMLHDSTAPAAGEVAPVAAATGSRLTDGSDAGFGHGNEKEAGRAQGADQPHRADSALDAGEGDYAHDAGEGEHAHDAGEGDSSSAAGGASDHKDSDDNLQGQERDARLVAQPRHVARATATRAAAADFASELGPPLRKQRLSWPWILAALLGAGVIGMVAGGFGRPKRADRAATPPPGAASPAASAPGESVAPAHAAATVPAGDPQALPAPGVPAGTAAAKDASKEGERPPGNGNDPFMVEDQNLPGCEVLAAGISPQSNNPPGEASVAWGQARNAIMKGDLELANRKMCEAVTLHSESAAIEGLALLYLTRGSPQQAMKWIQRAEALRPGQLETRNLLGDIYSQLGQSDRALDTWLAALNIGREDRPRREMVAREDAMVGRRHLKQGDLPRADRLLRRSVTLDPTNSSAWASLAEVCLKQGRAGCAHTFAERSLALSATSPEVFMVLGDAALLANDPVAARGYYERALQVRPDFWAATLKLRELREASP